MTADKQSYRAYEIQEHSVQSKIVAQTFKIKVLQPTSRTDGSERFPVLYATDSDYFFGAYAALISTLQDSGEAPRIILVGIGYGDVRAASWRWRDLFTHPIRALFHAELKQVAESPIVGAAVDVKSITETTDAQEFLRFIRDELMPFITGRYPTLVDNNSYVGYSAGATFGLYTLFSQPDTFRRYMLGSPSTSYSGHHFGIDLARNFIESARRLDVSVFLSVGELEEFMEGLGRYDLVTGYYMLVKFLRAAAIPGLDLTVRLFPGETHATAWMPAFRHGLTALFGSAERVPYWPDLTTELVEEV